MRISKGMTVLLRSTRGIPTRYRRRTATVVSRPQPNNRFVVEVSQRDNGRKLLLAVHKNEVSFVG